MSSSPSTQVSDLLGLLAATDVSLTSAQVNALLTLAALNFDLSPPDALGQAQDLISSINGELDTFKTASQNDVLNEQRSSEQEASYMAHLVTTFGKQASLVLGRNRVLSVITQAQDVSQR
jgi:hypothetical protein